MLLWGGAYNLQSIRAPRQKSDHLRVKQSPGKCVIIDDHACATEQTSRQTSSYLVIEHFTKNKDM